MFAVFKKICGAMVLGKLPVPGRPANLDHSRSRASALAVDTGGGGLEHFFFSHLSFLFFLPLSRLKYCLKGPLNPTNQLILTRELSLINTCCWRPDR